MVFCFCTSTIFVIAVVVRIGEEGADWFEGGGEGQATTTTITITAIGVSATAGVGWWHVASTGCVDRVRGEGYYRRIGLVVLVYPRQGLFVG